MPPIEFSKWMREVATDWVYRRGTGRRKRMGVRCTSCSRWP